MYRLLQGVREFQATGLGNRRELFRRLANGQSPEVLFITCSDSRIDPCLLTGSEPGELFVLRNAGNLVPVHGAGGGEDATIEYAVAGLGVRDVIVCGHSDCGAMKGLLDPEALAKLPATAAWVRQARATAEQVRAKYPSLRGAALATAGAQENVIAQLANLRTHPAVAGALASGTLRLHGWVYDIGTGQVQVYEKAQQRFVPLRGETGAGVPVAGCACAACEVAAMAG